jgi:hypothetical protein
MSMLDAWTPQLAVVISSHWLPFFFLFEEGKKTTTIFSIPHTHTFLGPEIENQFQYITLQEISLCNSGKPIFYSTVLLSM